MNSAVIFKACVEAIRNEILIEREGANDKEFHFQNWFRARLKVLAIQFDSPGRNTYPDFRLVKTARRLRTEGIGISR